jgi:hypothetical protein
MYLNRRKSARSMRQHRAKSIEIFLSRWKQMIWISRDGGQKPLMVMGTTVPVFSWYLAIEHPISRVLQRL